MTTETLHPIGITETLKLLSLGLKEATPVIHDSTQKSLIPFPTNLSGSTEGRANPRQSANPADTLAERQERDIWAQGAKTAVSGNQAPPAQSPYPPLTDITKYATTWITRDGEEEEIEIALEVMYEEGHLHICKASKLDGTIIDLTEMETERVVDDLFKQLREGDL